MISVTASAAEKITELLTEENKLDAGLRVFVQGGGCSGFQYGLMIEEGDAKTDADQTIESNGIRLFVDFLGHEDHAHAGAPERHSLRCPLAQGFSQPVPLHEEPDGRALASGENRSVNFAQVFWRAHFADQAVFNSGESERLVAGYEDYLIAVL